MAAVERSSLRICLAALLAALGSTGCSTTGETQATLAAPAAKKSIARERDGSVTRAEDDLQRGIRSYEDAEYEMAAKQLQSALDRGLPTRRDRASAYKYLAFVACSSGREKSCHAEFRKALEADPNFTLAPAEAGHPIWGPVFRSVKGEMAVKAKSP